MATTAQKLKLMYLAKLLESETDDEHGLTGPQIIQRLAELGIAVERKTLYRDLDCLREFGYNIVKYQRSPIEYGLASREFQESELLLLADAVQSSRFLTERKSNALVKAIGKLGSKYLADDLRRNLHVEGRIRSQNESVFYNIDAIQRAISAKKKYVSVTSNTTIGRNESCSAMDVSMRKRHCIWCIWMTAITWLPGTISMKAPLIIVWTEC